MPPGTTPSISQSEDSKLNVKMKKIRKNKQKDNAKISKTKKKQMSVQIEIEQELLYSCKICNKRFSKKQQIGGHQSKAHPGQSALYRKKMQTR